MNNCICNSSNSIASYKKEDLNTNEISILDIAISLESFLKTIHHIETAKDQNLLPHIPGMLGMASRECSSLVNLLIDMEASQ